MSAPAATGGHGAGSALLTVIGGYLGAGKTTLINRLLAGQVTGVSRWWSMTSAWGWFPGFRPGRTVVCADALSGRARAKDR